MSAKVLCLLPLAIVALLNPQRSQPSREHLIDLVAAAAAGEVAAVVPPARQLTLDTALSVGTHEPRRPPLAAIAIEAPTLDRGSYQIGDSFVFEVILLNTGKRPVDFPVLADAGRIDRDMPGASAASITLRFEDDELGSQQVGYHVLYGADPVHGSLVKVNPGERVRIRTPATWFLGNSTKQQMPKRWQRDLELRARLQFTQGKQYLEVVSTTTTAVRLEQDRTR
jgi:hypothetical protein